MDFGYAIAQLKRGQKVSRAGWNNSQMWLSYEGGFVAMATPNLPPDHAVKIIPLFSGDHVLRGRTTVQFAEAVPSVNLCFSDGRSLREGSLPSMADCMADDWFDIECGAGAVEACEAETAKYEAEKAAHIAAGKLENWPEAANSTVADLPEQE